MSVDDVYATSIAHDPWHILQRREIRVSPIGECIMSVRGCEDANGLGGIMCIIDVYQ